MKTRYLLFSIFVIGLFFMVSCDFSGINRDWSGSCLITYLNQGYQADYNGTVRSFYFESGGVCYLDVVDSFLTGSSTTKGYVGTYDYNERTHSLSYSLILMEIDYTPVISGMNYELSGSDTFNMESESGVLTSSISGGDIPEEAAIDVEFVLTAK